MKKNPRQQEELMKLEVEKSMVQKLDKMENELCDRNEDIDELKVELSEKVNEANEMQAQIKKDRNIRKKNKKLKNHLLKKSTQLEIMEETRTKEETNLKLIKKLKLLEEEFIERRMKSQMSFHLPAKSLP